MKTSLKNQIFAASALVFSFVFIGCGRGESGSSVRMREVSVTDSGSTGSSDSARMMQSGNCQSDDVGMIYDSQAGPAFRDRVGAFVSATMDPNSLGEISGDPNAATGIDLIMSVKVDQSGNVIQGSSMSLGIYDSLVGTRGQSGEMVGPYSVTIDYKVQGIVNQQTGDFQVQFADKDYGMVQFVGRMDQKKIQGTVSFQNFVSFNGGAPASGTLGQFVLPRCAVF